MTQPMTLNFRMGNVKIKKMPSGEAIVSKKIDWLIISGRPISSTHEAHSAIRIMPQCMRIGEAAGVAASICAKENVVPRDLDVKILQKKVDSKRRPLNDERVLFYPVQ